MRDRLRLSLEGLETRAQSLRTGYLLADLKGDDDERHR